MPSNGSVPVTPPTERPGAGPASELSIHHERIRRRGVNPFVYWVVRAVLQPFLQLYFRLRREGRGHIPADGPLLLAANHRSFLDPFVIACCIRRPIYFVAKRELFDNRLQGWFLNALGAFPVRRGEADEESLATARALLERGEAVLIFPEGTRIREGSLGEPRRGAGRLALETAAPIVPVALTGTDRARPRRFIVRPVRVAIRCGPPLRYPLVESPSPALATAVTDRIWPCVAIQWEWLGGDPPRRGPPAQPAFAARTAA
jgi:glycerol-3-phosphate dehydrogenase (NAD(P)+)